MDFGQPMRKVYLIFCSYQYGPSYIIVLHEYCTSSSNNDSVGQSTIDEGIVRGHPFPHVTLTFNKYEMGVTPDRPRPKPQELDTSWLY